MFDRVRISISGVNIPDDTGACRPCYYLISSVHARAYDCGDTASRADIDAIVAGVRPRRSRILSILAGAGVGAGMAALFFAVSGRLGGGAFGALTAGAILSLLFVAFEIVLGRRRRRAYRARHIAVILAAGRCPWCLYKLGTHAAHGPTAAPITCPECGGQWRPSLHPVAKS